MNFTNTIVIFTSNLGTERIQKARAEEMDLVREEIFALLRQHFRPELLNRIDEIVIFHALGRSEIRRIVDLQLEALQKLLDARGVRLVLSDAAKDALGRMGYDPEFGARPLKRTIQREVQNPLAKKLLAGEIRAGQTASARSLRRWGVDLEDRLTRPTLPAARDAIRSRPPG